MVFRDRVQSVKPAVSFSVLRPLIIYEIPFELQESVQYQMYTKYKDTVRTAQGTNFASLSKANRRMLCWRPVVVDCENYRESINRPLRRKPQLFC